MKVSIIGLGKLGLPMAALYASKGFEVMGIDVNPLAIQLLRAGKCPVNETGLTELLSKVKVQWESNYAAVAETDATFVIVPSPSLANGSFTSKYVVEAVSQIGRAIRTKLGYHLVVIVSTVMPGAMEYAIGPALESESGKRIGDLVGLCYNPEFIALGSVLHDMANPDSILIGESDVHAGEMVESIQYKLCDNHSPVCRMSWWNAEVAKVSLNVMLTTKINLANTIARICHVIPTGDVDKVTGFIGLDKRINNKLMKGGSALGGPCLPRDNRAFLKVAEMYGVNAPICTATDEANNTHSAFIAGVLRSLLGKEGKVVTLLGVTYKPNTCVAEESPAMAIASVLAGNGRTIRLYDPQWKGNCPNGVVCPTLHDALKGSDLAAVITPWPEFVYFDVKPMRRRVVFDCWRTMDSGRLQAEGVEYHALGVNG